MTLAPAAPARSTAGTAAASAATAAPGDFIWVFRWHLLCIWLPKMFNGPGGQRSVEVKLGEWGCHWSQLPRGVWFTTLATTLQVKEGPAVAATKRPKHHFSVAKQILRPWPGISLNIIRPCVDVDCGSTSIQWKDLFDPYNGLVPDLVHPMALQLVSQTSLDMAGTRRLTCRLHQRPHHSGRFL